MRIGKHQFIALAACVLFVASGRVNAEYRYDYSHGLEAYKDGDYTKARELFRKALEQNPEPAVRIRLYGQVWQPYLPQYYLGLIAFKQGDCKTALAQWDTGQNQAIVDKVPTIATDQQRDVSECKRRLLATSNPAQPSVPAGVPVSVPKPKIVAENNPKTTVPSRQPPEVSPPPKKAVSKVSVPTQKIETSNQPPQSLVHAFDEYLAGRYEQVERIEPDTYTDSHARFQAYLLRAAAKFTRARMSGDDRILGGARQDVQAARALDSQLAPDAIMFSPTFRIFYKRQD